MLPREDYPMVIRTELQQLEFELTKLQTRLEAAGDDAQAAYQEFIDVMRAKLQQARMKLKALENAGDDRWDEVKADLDQTRDVIKSMLSNTIAQVS